MFTLSYPGLAISLGWFFCVPRELWVPVLMALLAFCSPSASEGLLLLMLMQVFAFIQASTGTRRENNGVVQKRFILVFSGSILALFGQAIGVSAPARWMVLIGLLLMIPNGVTSFFFARFYERLTLRAYLGAVVIPSFVAIDLLFKLRGGMQADLGVLWSYSVLILASITLLTSGLMGFIRLRFRSVMVFWTQFLMGLSLFILGSEQSAGVEMALVALALLAIASPLLLSFASQLGERYYVFSRVAVLALPGMAGFAGLFLVLKVLFAMGPEWVGVVFAGYLLQVMTLVLCKPKTPSLPSRRARIGFTVVMLVQLISGSGLFWLAMEGGK